MSRVFVTGDIHGNPKRLSNNNWPTATGLSKQDVVIILGDFGLLWSEYRTKEEDYWLEWLDSRPFTTCFIDGNHENFDILDNVPQKCKYGGRVGIVGHSVFHLQRGQVYHINHMKLLTIGGAHSHDRQYRTWGKSMWKEEEITDADITNAKFALEGNSFGVDYVLTHCAPVSKARGAMAQNAAHLWSPDASEERLQEIWDHPLFFKKWFCGHYHTDHGPTYDGKFECVQNQIIELKGVQEDGN